MQTLSRMRRSRFNLQPLIALLLFGAALIYESVGTIYPVISPLLGVGFYAMRRFAKEKAYYFPLLLVLLYTLYFEIDRGMFLGSFWLLALLYHLLIAQSLESGLNCPLCLKLFYAVYAYIGYYLLNLFLAFIFNMPLPHFDEYYLFYAVTDFIILALLT